MRGLVGDLPEAGDERQVEEQLEGEWMPGVASVVLLPVIPALSLVGSPLLWGRAERRRDCRK